MYEYDEKLELMVDLFARPSEWIYSFLNRMIAETLSGKIIWKLEMNTYLMWDNYYTFSVKSKIKRRNLYADFSYIKSYGKNKVYINNLYTFIKGEYCELFMFLSEYAVENELELLGEDKLIYELSQAIISVIGNPFELIDREIAILRINFMNSVYDSFMGDCSEYHYCGNGKFESCDYRICMAEDSIHVLKFSTAAYLEFRFNRSELNSIMRTAYGDIEYSEFDYRFIKLIDMWGHR